MNDDDNGYATRCAQCGQFIFSGEPFGPGLDYWCNACGDGYRKHEDPIEQLDA